MSFRISIKGHINHLDFFYPDLDWEETYADDDESKELIEKCLDVCPRDIDTILLLMEQLEEREMGCWVPGAYIHNPQQEAFSVEENPGSFRNCKDLEVENPFDDYELPEPEDIFDCVKNQKFCYIKVWENSELWYYDGDGDFDISKLTYERGKFMYDGNEFESGGGDGSSSYTAFYRDGTICT